MTNDNEEEWDPMMITGSPGKFLNGGGGLERPLDTSGKSVVRTEVTVEPIS